MRCCIIYYSFIELLLNLLLYLCCCRLCFVSLSFVFFSVCFGLITTFHFPLYFIYTSHSHIFLIMYFIWTQRDHHRKFVVLFTFLFFNFRNSQTDSQSYRRWRRRRRRSPRLVLFFRCSTCQTNNKKFICKTNVSWWEKEKLLCRRHRFPVPQTVFIGVFATFWYCVIYIYVPL